MSEWKEYKLKEFTEIQTGPFGSQLHASDYVNFGIPSIMPTNIGNRLNIVTDKIVFVGEEDIERLKRYTVKESDIVYSRRGDVEKCAYITKDQIGWLCGTGCLRIRFTSKNISPKFCAYYLSTPQIKSWVLNSAVGTTMPNLNTTILGELPLIIPNIDEQVMIAEVLTSIDDKINLLLRQNQTLQKLAATIFRQWFVENGDDNSKEIQLKDIYTFEKGIEPGSKFYSENPNSNSIRFIRVGDMEDNRATLYIDKELSKGKTCTKNDLLVSFDGTVGRVMFGVEGCYSSGMRKIYSENPLFNSLWLKHQIFTSKEIQDEINVHVSGTVILHAGSSIEYLKIKFPNKEKLKECHEVINPLYDKIEKNILQTESLKEIRETLLPKLMNGEATIKEI